MLHSTDDGTDLKASEPVKTAGTTSRTCVRLMEVVLAALIVGIVALAGMYEWQQAGEPACCASASVTLVQSIPVGDFAIAPVTGSIPTHEAFISLANSARSTLDLTAMYVALSGDEAREHFSASALRRMGAGRGADVFGALEAAARRGVAIRLLLGTLGNPMNGTEVRSLLRYPSVQARTWDPDKWYQGGIMHLKLWHADGEAAYIGSANPDWKSLAQVKELGVLINGSASANSASANSANSAGIAANSAGRGATADLGRVFEVFWKWADPSLHATPVQAWSDQYQVTLTLPPWDPLVPADQRDPSTAPFSLRPWAPLAALSSAAKPQCLHLAGAPSGAAPASAFVSGSPGGALTSGRTPDIDALLLTIRSARKTLSLSVMDFLPASGYSGGRGGAPAWWPTLVDAILAVAYAKPVRVRLLVSHWAHTGSAQPVAMRRLADGLAACRTAYQKCAGSLEVRQMQVPGWNLTYGATPSHVKPAWPSYSRVVHQKFIVSDERLNIGTSNWEWGYFHQTAGGSWNTNASALVASAQAVFDADWASPYATALAP